MKKIVIGLPSKKYLTFDELKSICEVYGDKIDCWYVSMPYIDAYQSRLQLSSDSEKDRHDGLNIQLKILRNYNQHIELALNNLGMTDSVAISESIDIEKFLNEFGNIDRFVAVDKIIPHITKYNIPITYSYNNVEYDTEYLKYCDRVVLGNRDIRNISLMKKLHEDNKSVELLVNNGCHFACTKQCGEPCETSQNKLIEKNGIDYCLAEQSFLPYELDYVNNYIDLIKISSRPSNYNYLNTTLEAYTNMWDKDEIKNKLNMSNFKNWYYFCRLQNLIRKLDNYNINYEKIIQLKDDIWKDILD